MKRSAFIIVAIFFYAISISTFAQTNYKPGFVITNSGDSLIGSINDASFKKGFETCIFRNRQGSESVYSPGDIQSYGFVGGRLVESVIFKGEEYFFQILVEGIMNLYYYRGELPSIGVKTDESYYIKNEQGEFFALTNTQRQFYDSKGEITGVKDNKEYVGVLKYIMADVPEVSKKIDNVDFKVKSLISITEDYHNAVCDDYSCNIYTQTGEAKISYGFMGGVKFAKSTIKDSDGVFMPRTAVKKSSSQTSYVVGAFVEIHGFFGMSDRFSFRPEIFVTNSEFNFEEFTYTDLQIALSLPSFRYYLLSGKTNPYIGLGVNTHLCLNQSVTENGNYGLNNSWRYAKNLKSNYFALNIAAGVEYVLTEKITGDFMLKYSYRFTPISPSGAYESGINSLYLTVGVKL